MESLTRSRRSEASALGALLVFQLCALSAAAAPSAEAQARALFKEGEIAYNTADFDKAVTLYQKAYELKPLPGFLFNIGQAWKQKGDSERAAFFFSRFIDTTSPKDPNLETARALLAEAQAKLAAVVRQKEQAEAEARKVEEERKARELEASVARSLTAPPPPPALVETPVTQKWWFWTLIGVGAAAAAGGGYAAYYVTNVPPTMQPATLGTIGTSGKK